MKRKFISISIALVLALSLCLVTAVPVSAGTINVSEFTSIQDAIDDPNTLPGDTIIVAPGTYTEDVTVDKNLILEGAQVGADPRGGRAGEESEIVGVVVVTSDAANVTIDGFTLTSPTRSEPPRGFNLHIESETSTVRNNILFVEATTNHSPYGNYLDLFHIGDSLVEQNTFGSDDNTAQTPNVIGLTLAGSGSTVTIQNNEMHDAGGGGGIGIICNDADAVINITGNEMDNTGDGVWVWHWEGSNFDALSITDNDIHDCQKIGVKVVAPVTGTVSVSGNDFQDNNIQVDTGGVLNVEEILANNTFDRAVVVRGNPIIKVPIIFSSIQDAVGAAVADDTVDVAKGMYEENVSIGEPLTLRGAQAGNSAIDRTGDEAEIVGGITVSSGVSDFTIDGFKSTQVENQMCMNINSASAMIINNIIVAMKPTGGYATNLVYLNGVSTANIHYNDFFGEYNDLTRPNVLQLITAVDASTVTVANNEMHDVGGGGGIAITGNGAGAVIEIIDNVIDNTGDGIWTFGPAFGTLLITGNDLVNCHDSGLGGTGSYIGVKVAGGVTGDVQIHNNNIEGNEDYGVFNDSSNPLVDATNNWWSSASGPAHASNTYTAPTGDLQGDAVSDNVRYVPWLGALGGAPFAPITLDDPEGQFSSIQAAINAATGTTITCAVGTFTENVLIEKRLTLQGAGSGDDPASNTIITPPSGNGIDICLPLGGPAVPTLIIQNLRVANAPLDGIQVTDSGGDNNQGNWTLNNVACVGNGKMGVDLNLNPIKNLEPVYAHDVTVTESIFSNNAQFGFKINHGAGSVKITITGGEMNDNVAGLQALGHPDRIREISVDGVTFEGNTAVGVDFGAKDDYCFNDGVVNLQNLIIVGNGIGMRFKGEGVNSGYSPGYLLPAGTISVLYCDIIGNDTGVLIQNYSELDNMGLHYNNIYGNTVGLANQCADIVDALYNWWGDETGSKAILNLGAQGNAVSNNVDFSPWLYKTQEEFISGAPCYAGSVVLSNEATEVETGSYAGGWNTFSTPILLVSEADTISDLLALTAGSDLSIVRAQRFNPISQGWDLLVMNNVVEVAYEDYQIKPGEGFFIQVSTEGSLPILCSMELLWPQTRELSSGWNLVGATSYLDKVVEDNILLGAATVVNSPGANPASWSYLPAATFKLLLPGRAYWVGMSADGTLMCFDGTPVADDLTWHLNQ